MPFSNGSFTSRVVKAVCYSKNNHAADVHELLLSSHQQLHRCTIVHTLWHRLGVILQSSAMSVDAHSARDCITLQEQIESIRSASAITPTLTIDTRAVPPLSHFEEITPDEVAGIIRSWLIKNLVNVLSPVITDMANALGACGCFSVVFHHFQDICIQNMHDLDLKL